LQSRLKDFKKADTQILGISVDGMKRSADLAKKLSLTFPILLDTSLKVIRAYRVNHEKGGYDPDAMDIARPALFVIDRKGVIVWRHFTENWRVRKRPDKILSILNKIP